MLHVIKLKNKKHLKWLSIYLKRKKISYFSFFNFLFIKKINFSQVDYIYTKSIRSYKFISTEFGYNVEVLKYITDNYLKSYKLAEILLFLTQNNFKVIIKKKYDFDDSNLEISILKYNDLLMFEKIKEDDYFVSKDLLKVLNGEKIMSKEKENKIIDYISKYLIEYGINLSLYEYIIKETGNNIYEVNLIHMETEKTILITNIVFNNTNNIVEIGKHNGLVL